MSTYLGDKIAQSILRQRNNEPAHSMLQGRTENPFAQIPFPNAPLGIYNGRPWFLPLAGAWYKLLDWIS
jgi:hypothetical protein